MTNQYESPLSSRYASEYMLNLFSNDTRYSTWRRLWESLARAEYALGLSATENLMTEAVKRGGDRQEIHEIIHKRSMEATAHMKNGEECDLTARLAAEPTFGMSEAEIGAILEPSKYIGRCSEQVDAFLAKVKPLLKGVAGSNAEINL